MSSNAIGLIEAFGLVYILEATDKMIKESGVKLLGYENVASGYISILVEGDLEACKLAVDAGVKAIENMGQEVYSSYVIANPHPEIKTITDQYKLENLI